MRGARRRASTYRTTRFESVEQRQLLAADFTTGLFAGFSSEIAAVAPQTTPEQAHDLTGLTDVVDDYGFDGQGQTVVVIDSGVAYDHTSLGGRVILGPDYAEGDNDPYDDGFAGSHGTHVAGIIASDHEVYCGVAPGVDVVAIRVFDDSGAGYFEWVESALAWVHENLDAFDNPITTVNMSLGAEWNSDSIPGWAILEEELAQLYADDVFITVSAGNSFTSYNAPGVNYPAASPYVTPVASVDSSGDLSNFSQRSADVIAAPGEAIWSTVPDYEGDWNGIDDDFTRFSGTSMAAPYVAGASMLIRQAYEFAGAGDVTPEMINQLLHDTADRVYDGITGVTYDRLNLARAIDAIMPADDYGSALSDAHNLGTLDSAATVAGAVATLDDADWFRFTAAAGGTVTLSAQTTLELDAKWDLRGVSATQIADGSLVFSVEAGQTVSFGLSTSDGLGYYTLDVSLEADPAVSEPDFTDLGSPDQATFDDVFLERDAQFEVTTVRAGLWTLEASRAAAAFSVLDAGGRVLASSDSGRVDLSVDANQTLTVVYDGAASLRADLTVTNLVQVDVGSVFVFGTARGDEFLFEAGSSPALSINGTQYVFGTSVVRYQFDGAGGADSVVLTGSAASEDAVLSASAAELRGATYEITTSNTEINTVVSGGGNDRVTMLDSAGDDVLTTSPDEATLVGLGFENRAVGFRKVHAYATAGGTDTAALYDSAGNDTLTASPQEVKLAGSTFYTRVKYFDSVTAYAESGNDTARFTDSAGNDVFTASPETARLVGDGFDNAAVGFRYVYAAATSGGNDVARIVGSAENDALLATPDYGKLEGSDFYLYVSDFNAIVAESGGGDDSAEFYDSAGDDTFDFTPDSAVLGGADYSLRVDEFAKVEVNAFGGGNDVARFTGQDFYDRLFYSTGYTKFEGSGFFASVRAFDEVHAVAGDGGGGTAQLFDSTGSDHLFASGDVAELLGNAGLVRVSGFESVHAFGTAGGENTKEVSAIDFLLNEYGDWKEG